MFLEEGPKVLYRLAVTCLVLCVEGLHGELRCLCHPRGASTADCCSPYPEHTQAASVEVAVEAFVSGMSWEVRGAWFKVTTV